jgi:hypothetical protein
MTLTYSPDAITVPEPIDAPRRGPKAAASQSSCVSHTDTAGGADIPDANGRALPTPQSHPGVDPAAPATSVPVTPIRDSSPALLDDTLLYFAAADLDAIEGARKASKNRLTVLTTPKDKLRADGKAYGHGRTLDDPLVQESAKLLGRLKELEDEHVRHLERLMRKHPLSPWVKTHVGIGEKQAARLLGAIGDPYWNTLHNRPRTVSELWAYCGLHVLPASHPTPEPQTRFAGGDQTGDPDHPTCDAHGTGAGVAAKRRKGLKANWSTDAKTRTWLIAKQVVMQNGAPDKNGQRRALSPYRAVYDNRRAHTATTHPEWSPLHSQNDALRIVSKAILKDLWLVARDLHQAAGTEVPA